MNGKSVWDKMKDSCKWQCGGMCFEWQRVKKADYKLCCFDKCPKIEGDRNENIKEGE